MIQYEGNLVINEYTVFETVKGRRVKVDCPPYVSSEGLGLPPNAVKVLEKRYLRRDETGETIETPAGMFYRVAAHVASAGSPFMTTGELTKNFYNLMTERRFYPNSPTFTGAATPLGQLAACFVLGIDDDLGKEPQGIFNTLRVAALIQQTGGGNGFSFSRLRHKGDAVNSTGGIATGPVGFMRAYDAAFGVVAQGGVRRGANMGVLRVDSPDIEEFIECKAKEGELVNFNISVGITDEFMQQVKANGDFALISPRTKQPIRIVRAKDLFDKIVKYACRNGEPGILFLDAANRSNPVPHLYELEATNPCGEQWLGPYENCCLGSINLAVHVRDGAVDWDRLKKTIVEATHFLDNVVTVNAYVPAVPEIKAAGVRARRIGLGIMGLADMMYQMGIRYGGEEGQEFAAQVMEFVRFHCMAESVRLAAYLGSFEAIEGSIYDARNGDIAWRIPIPLVPYTHDWDRPELDWIELQNRVAMTGIRNAAQTTIAPTGTIATVCGCEGYGCEPVFALGYTRHFKDGDKDVELTYTSPLFEQALRSSLSSGVAAETIKDVAESGSCQLVYGIPDEIRNTFVVSSDITAEEHVRMQAAMQAFVDNSLSKTCNFPENATEADVAKAYMLAWELGCKGLTVYVTGSRDKVVLETKATKDKKTETVQPVIVPEPVKLPRPAYLQGATYRKETPLGHAYITVNSDEQGQPFEVFLNVGKAGSDVCAVSEAIGRLTSLLLRVPSSTSPADRLAWAVDELSGIGGGRPMGFGAKRVRSLPDGIAQALFQHLKLSGPTARDEPGFSRAPLGDICPECGEATLLNAEGCRKCQSCGYSEC